MKYSKRESQPAQYSGVREQTHDVSEIDDKVDILHSEIVASLFKISSKSLLDTQAQELSNLLSADNDI